MWSIVAVLVKVASADFSNSAISLCRFLFGIVFLLLYIYLSGGKPKLYFKNKWIWIGAVAKSANYICENLAITLGYAYGFVISAPLQAIYLFIISCVFLREKINLPKLIAAILCVSGVVLISWNGLPVFDILNTSGIITLLFALSAIGTGTHMLSQRILINKMSSENMNLSMLFLCTFLTATPVPFSFHIAKSVNPLSVVALVALGFITGISFLIFSNIIHKVNFFAAAIIINLQSLFSLIWPWLFLHEPITPYVITGACIILAGLTVLSLSGGSIKPKIQAE